MLFRSESAAQETQVKQGGDRQWIRKTKVSSTAVVRLRWSFIMPGPSFFPIPLFLAMHSLQEICMGINTRVVDLLRPSRPLTWKPQTSSRLCLYTSRHEASFIARHHSLPPFSCDHSLSPTARPQSTLPTDSNAWLVTQFPDQG